MTDQEIVKRCEKQIKKYRSISVGHFMDTILKIGRDKMTARRIKARLLENPKYMEDSEIDADGLHRIRYAAKKPLVERYWLAKEIIIAVVGAIAGYLLRPLIEANQQEGNRQERKTEFVQRADSLNKK